MEIFKLIGSVMVDTADAEKSISKTSDEAEGLGKKLSNGIKTAGKWAAGVTAGAIAVGGAMLSAAKDTASTLDVIDKASQRMKISSGSYQELAHAAGLCGVEMGTLEKAAKKLEGTDLTFDEALDQIYALGTAEERAAKASELFGESVAYQMTPMLNASAEDMAAMRQEAHDLGLVMSDEAVANGAAMNDMFGKIDESIAALKTGLVSELMPYVMEILNWVIENIPRISKTVSTVMNAIMPIVRPILNGIMSLVTGFTALLDGDIHGFIQGILDFLGGLGEAFTTVGEAIFTGLWNGLVSVWNSISTWVSEKVSWLADKLMFWRSGSNEMDGESHAGGLPFVPYDNYPALLHRGETVMTAADSADLLANVKKIAANGGTGPINITVQSVLDGRIIGESVTSYQRARARAMG